ncbi:MAG: SufE family protein [Caldilineales bacterium]
MTSLLPPRLKAIVDEFASAEGREKLDLLLDFAQSLPPLPERWAGHAEMDQVHECMSPVFVAAEQHDSLMEFFFDVPPEAPTVRGYAALMAEGLNGSTAEEILGVPADFFQAMGLQQVISLQRMKGIGAILAHMKRLTLQMPAQSSEPQS